MAALRTRQRALGLESVTVVVPSHARQLLRSFARQLRALEEALPAAGLSKTADEKASTVSDPRPSSWAQLSGLKLRPGNMKLGELLARNLAHEIVQGGWQVGMSMGTEDHLLDRYSVGRNILREAIRILEFHGIARMRLGTGGGLVITTPDMDSTIFGIGLFLESRGISLPGLIRVRRALEMLAFEQAVAKWNAASAGALREAIANEGYLGLKARASDLQSFHKAIAKLSGDPVIELFMDTVLRTFRFHSNFPARRAADPQLVTRVMETHSRMCTALEGNNIGLAHDILQDYLDGLDAWAI